jgi:hypothetical protein
MSFAPARTLVRALALTSAAVLSLPSVGLAADRLAWTAGVAPVEGGAGGGIVPFALIAGLGTEDEVGVAASATRVATQDFRLTGGSLAIGIRDRVELSFARDSFDLGDVVPGQRLGLDVVGAKVRVAGDAVFAAHPWAPQVSLGVQYKHARDFDPIPRAVGARRADGVDVYVAATRVFLDGVAGRNVLVNAVLRRTDANQFGLLGFGGDAGRGARWCPEATVGIWPAERWLVGVEYRSKPSLLRAFREEHAADAFVAYGAGKQFTLVAGWADLGSVAGTRRQRGSYLSAWVGF